MVLSRIFAALLMLPLLAMAAETEMSLDPAPDKSHDQAALQRGAKVFVQYCLSCHPAGFMRYNRLRDIGFTKQQIKDELICGQEDQYCGNSLYAARKFGAPMNVAMDRSDARRWFGMMPPDLSLLVRARTSDLGPGENWVYSYLRSFYRDPTRPSSWNNVIFKNVAMHHVLWELQGEQVLGADHKLRLANQGKLSPRQYDELVGDLVAFLKYMSEPSAMQRRHVGIYVLLAMGILLFFSIIIKPPGKKPGRAAYK